MNLFYKYSMNIHHLQKMLVTNLVLGTKCYNKIQKLSRCGRDMVECMRSQEVLVMHAFNQI